MSDTYKLLAAAASNGAVMDVSSRGDFVFSVAGLFGGASVGLQMLGFGGVTWITLKDQVGAIAVTAPKLMPAFQLRTPPTESPR